MHALVIHGGAGVVAGRLAAHPQAAFEAGLGHIIDSCFAMLEADGSSLDVVTAAVRMLEDDPLFNAGRGSGLSRDGTVEMDASIMDGRDQRAGAVACVTGARNPVELARRVMDDTSHVMLVGAGADAFAVEQGLPIMPNDYFKTEERRTELADVQAGRVPYHMRSPQGTVGAVALDKNGHIAAATSTGGTTNKIPGRAGDTPIIGAGTYAKDGVCGFSATGYGEYFIRTVAGYRVAALMEYRGLSLQDAAREVVQDVIPGLGGNGGIIAIDAAGTIVTEFNTEGMFRAARDSSGQRLIAITR